MKMVTIPVSFLMAGIVYLMFVFMEEAVTVAGAAGLACMLFSVSVFHSKAEKGQCISALAGLVQPARS